ncbi:MAG TPA: DUF4215 domain-containing protein [Sandaracinaceae bacterium LLY-WYZ-13_1]|nr:DUF4215 domain-containing protein [Sandaracinaceae bacterium LLY-WYZ-13_1]
MALLLATSLAGVGCDGGDDEMDAGTTDAGEEVDGSMTDPCEGLALCETEGASCDGDTLVTCAENADGCLVEMEVDCALGGQVCDDSGDEPMCVEDDPCASIPADERCDTEGRTCDGDTLEVCAANADGCLVLETTDCAEADGGACDDSGAMPMCVVPEDPCDGIADACTTAGTTCTDDTLVTCAPNAFGCLVETTADCSARAGGTCDDSGAAAECTFTGDPCDDVTECDAAGVSCDGPELVTCEADAYGCLVETRTDCTDSVAFGFCDAEATTPMCSTAATDPCMGMTECSAEGRSCSGDSLVTCAPNAFGCLVEESTDCTASGEVCGETDGMSMCGDVCDFRTTCPSAMYCDGTDSVTCSADADGCLIEDSRSTCDGPCDAGACVGTCGSASPTLVDCASGTVSGDTAMGAALISDYTGCTTSTDYAGNEQVFVFRNAGRAEVAIESTRGASSGDYDLFVLDGGDGSGACDSGLSCIDGSRGIDATENVEFVAEAGQLYYVVFDIYSDTSATSTVDLDVSCTPIVCGDGTIAGGEECDDGGTSPGDGCSDTCTVEPDYVCTGEPSTCEIACGNGTIESDLGEECDDGGTSPGDGCSDTCTVEPGYGCSGEPSTCTMLEANADCAGAIALGANDSVTSGDVALGGPRPSGTDCGFGSGPVLWYEVTVPAMSETTFSADPTGGTDLTLHVLDSCGASACLEYEDGGNPETTTLTNSTGSAVVYYVAVGAYFSSGSGTVNVTTSTPVCGDGAVEGTEECDDGDTSSGDGCSDICLVESGFSCSGEPSTCVSAAANAECSGATVLGSSGSVTGEDTSIGGPEPSGSGCTSGDGLVLWYEVTVPAGNATTVTVTTADTSFDAVIDAFDACGAAACVASEDGFVGGGTEELTLTNPTGTDQTRYVAVGEYASSASGIFDIAVSSAPLPFAMISASCVDTSAGTSLTGAVTDDGASAVTPLPFSFSFQGEAVTHFSVTSNGFVQLYTSASGTVSTAYSNDPIPDTAAPDLMAAVFWDDLRPNTGADVRTLTTGSAGSQVFVVEWNDFDTYSSDDDVLRFQLQVDEATGAVEYHYCSMENGGGSSDRYTGASATIGIENAAGDDGIEISYETAGAAMTGNGYRIDTP